MSAIKNIQKINTHYSWIHKNICPMLVHVCVYVCVCVCVCVRERERDAIVSNETLKHLSVEATHWLTITLWAASWTQTGLMGAMSSSVCCSEIVWREKKCEKETRKEKSLNWGKCLKTHTRLHVKSSNTHTYIHTRRSDAVIKTGKCVWQNQRKT